MPRAKVNGVEINYLAKGEGQALVLLHGIGTNNSIWANQVEFFSKYYRVIVFDFRGFGDSDKSSDDYSVETFAQDLDELLEKLDVDRIHLLGTSMGGYVAQHFALTRQKVIFSLILAHTRCTRGLPPEKRKERLEAIRNSSMATYGRLVAKQAIFDQSNSTLVDFVAELIERNDKNCYIQTFLALDGFDVCQRLNQITAPTLVIAGENDGVIPKEFSYDLAKRIDRAELVVIRRSGHLSYLENPLEFNAQVSKFLLGLK